MTIKTFSIAAASIERHTFTQCETYLYLFQFTTHRPTSSNTKIETGWNDIHQQLKPPIPPSLFSPLDYIT